MYRMDFSVGEYLQAAKNTAADLAHSMTAKATVVGVSTLGFMASAHAALDESVTTAFDAVKADAVSLSGIVVPIVVSVLGLVITIKLIKRFGSKI